MIERASGALLSIRQVDGESHLDLKMANFATLKSSITMEINMLKNQHPSHPGEILNEIYLSQLGWSQTKLAEKLGCAHRKVNEIINGKRAISPDFALDLESVLEVEAEMWVRLQAEFDLYQARKKRDAA